MSQTDPRPFSERLLQWWDENGRQDLPWQHPRTAYRVLVSEIMLQQTQVSTVIPYFDRWMEAFPDLPALAAAPLDEVLSLWSGLGYYARARNLHQAARTCMSRHDGQVPTEAAALGALPGVGLSTANAIVSQATDRPAAVLDGNVRRVLARHEAIEGWTGKRSVQNQLWKEAEARLPAKRGADYTQAIMDLGALICSRSKPRCESCPVNADCKALAQKQVELLPSPKPKTKISERTVCMLIIRDQRSGILLEKRPPSGIWGGLWSLPEGDSIVSIEAGLGLGDSRSVELPPFTHRLSHVRMLIRPYLATEIRAGQVKCTHEQQWFSTDEQSGLGLPRPVSELLSKLSDLISENTSEQKDTLRGFE